MIRPFKNVDEFKSVTGFKIGDAIHLRCTAKDGEHDFIGQFTGYEVVKRNDETEILLYIGAGMYLLESLVNANYLTKENKWLPLGVEIEPKNEIKYRFEEGKVYSTENNRAITILKRITVGNSDYAIIQPKSFDSNLAIERIYPKRDSEFFLCELDNDDKPASIYASKLFNKITNDTKEEADSNKDEENTDNNDDDTVEFVFKLK